MGLQPFGRRLAEEDGAIEIDHRVRVDADPERVGGAAAEVVGSEHQHDRQPVEDELENLPEALGNLSSLTELDLRNNKLMALPESLGGLSNLVYLDLRANPLTMLPASIGNLPRLEKLDLRWTRLASTPEWFERLEARGCGIYL